MKVESPWGGLRREENGEKHKPEYDILFVITLKI
jgi:hypothetical protein